jgi:hypothetical protein
VTEDDVRKMANAWAAASSYRLTITSKESGQNEQVLMEVVKPDKQHLKVSGGDQNVEVIQIGSDTYVNLGGTWTKSPAGAPMAADLFDPDEIVNGFNESASNGQTIVKGGTRTVGGAQCQDWTLQGGDPSDAGTMCIGVNDNLPREFTAADGSATMTFSDWNAPITITAPI